MKKSSGGILSVAVFLNRRSKGSRDQVAGILRYASSREAWHLHIMSRPAGGEDLERVLAAMRPDGIIAGSASIVQAFRRRCRRRIPAVVLDCFEPPRGIADGIVLCPDHAIGDAAASFFVSRGFRNFAFAGIGGEDSEFESFNSRNRENGFRRTLAKAGHAVSTYVENVPSGGGHYADGARLGCWLGSLPKPCAILAHSDMAAQSVIAACRKRRIQVPLQVAVLGVDNDPEICESTAPSISSAAPDYQGAGYMAAETLDMLMRGADGKRAVRRATYGFLGIVERMSTRSMAGSEARVARALEIVRKRALSGVTVRQVADELYVSPRSLEIAFRNASRRSVRDEIIAVRMAEATRLLRNTRLRIDDISARCGFRTTGAFKSVFKRRFGLSVRNWRKSGR